MLFRSVGSVGRLIAGHAARWLSPPHLGPVVRTRGSGDTGSLVQWIPCSVEHRHPDADDPSFEFQSDLIGARRVQRAAAWRDQVPSSHASDGTA